MIELLAVIILIGVIALIVSPMIIGTIKKTKKSAFERSIDGIIDSVRIDYSEDQFLTPREYYYDGNRLTLLTVGGKTRDEEVKISGKIDGNGFIYVDAEGNVNIENICNKEYCVSGPEGDIDINDNPTGEMPELNKKDPMIKLNGDSIIYVELNGTYKELGAIARTKVGEPLEYQTEIKQNNNIVSNVDTSKEGEYIVTYRTTSNNKTVTVERKVIVLEMTPVITMTEPNSNYVKEQEVLITVSGKLPNKITKFTYQINDGEMNTVNGTSKKIVLNTTGIRTIKVTVTDDHNHTATLSKNYKIDRIPPMITFNPELVTLSTGEVQEYDLLTGVSIEDNIDGVIDTSRVTTSGTLISKPGTYEVTYQVSDQAGNETVKVRTFQVEDQTKPEITINPNEQSSFVKSKMITITATDDTGIESIKYVVIKDEVRGEEVTITSGGQVTLNETGNYKIEVTAIDTNNNRETKTSGIYKIDATVPVIVFPESTIVKTTEVATFNLLTNVTVTDNSGESITPRVSGSLSTTLGNQTITYTATDSSGNTATKTRTITVVEAEGPILNFSSISSNNKWVKAQEITVTATDNSNLSSFTYEVFKNNVSQGVQTVSVSGKSASATVALSTDGTYSIKLTGRDQYGNSNSSSSGTYKIDVTKPTITMSNVTIKDNEVASYNLMTGVTVSDNSGITPTVKTTGTLGTTPKDYTITYTVTDEAGNVTTATRTITVEASKGDITGAEKPDLTNGLVPIKWNGSNWIKADESNPGGTYQWYDYEKQMWANAASVTSEYRNVAVGTTIPESAVLAYFVWIPRYEYQYTNLGDFYAGGTKELPGEISINFISSTKTSPSNNNYKIHPSFTFGTKELSGIWVGKFQTTGTGNSPTIKPNLTTLTYSHLDLKVPLTTSQKFSVNGNNYGISTSADAHMMKNSEWGAVAYLSQSKYGKMGNVSYTGTNKEVYINNNSKDITGCSGGSPSASESSNCTYTYEKALSGTGASTSGTIYGVYDMHGGTVEYVMALTSDTTSFDSKYYDKYTTTDSTTACSGGICYGHALSETSEWYLDKSGFISRNFVMYRGGKTGIFSTEGGTTFTQIYGAFRVVLVD